MFVTVLNFYCVFISVPTQRCVTWRVPLGEEEVTQIHSPGALSSWWCCSSRSWGRCGWSGKRSAGRCSFSRGRCCLCSPRNSAVKMETCQEPASAEWKKKKKTSPDWDRGAHLVSQLLVVRVVLPVHAVVAVLQGVRDDVHLCPQRLCSLCYDSCDLLGVGELHLKPLVHFIILWKRRAQAWVYSVGNVGILGLQGSLWCTWAEPSWM